MPLPWIRLDTQFASNPKILMLVEDKKWRAVFCWLAGLGYSGAHGTDGFLPGACLPLLQSTRREAADLVEVRLWHEMQGGWEINGWNEYQQSSEETAERSRKAKLAAHKRWANAKTMH